MRIGKKLAQVVLSMFLLVALIPNVADAASGRIYFTDPTTEAGVEFNVTVTTVSYDDSLSDIEVVLDYDNTMIEFLSGDGVTSSGSQLTYTVEDANIGETSVVLTFMALKEGSTSITISSQSVMNSSDEAFEITEGYSAITISGGTEVEPSSSSSSTSVTTGSDVVTVDDVSYTIATSSFASVIPSAYTETTFEYAGNTYYGAQGDTSGIILAYLVTESGDGALFCFDEDDNSFYPYVQVSISDSVYIVFSRTEIGGVLPDQYVETILSVNGYEFPTWEDTSNSGIYLIYATNSDGEELIYQYDSVDKTYQRYVEASISSEDVDAAGSGNFFSENSNLILIVCVSLVIVLGAVIIVLGFTVYNRNTELDDLYDELEALEAKQKAAKKAAANAGKPMKKAPAKPGAKPPVKTGAKPPVKSGAKPGAKPGVKPGAKPGAKPPVKTGAKPPVKPPVKPITESLANEELEKEEYESISVAIAKEFKQDKVIKEETFMDDFDDNFDDGFDDDFDTTFASKDFDKDFEVTLPKKMMNEEKEPTRSIKNATAKRRDNTTRYDDIDFIDL